MSAFIDKEPVVAEMIVGIVNQDVKQHASEQLFAIVPRICAARLQQIDEFKITRSCLTGGMPGSESSRKRMPNGLFVPCGRNAAREKWCTNSPASEEIWLRGQ
jgi:hypothetical protein